eukprot:TRINITY_DN8773_c0_g2_i1.p1 TRINITY_DN8773_c0_g2~~TRINITY_DN8773_c0_g2_i1.p1  ORF type:complete len:112 (-),score=23.38 TRINITY_DN8773_c0_g2_i1:195-530(-)
MGTPTSTLTGTLCASGFFRKCCVARSQSLELKKAMLLAEGAPCSAGAAIELGTLATAELLKDSDLVPIALATRMASTLAASCWAAPPSWWKLPLSWSEGAWKECWRPLCAW